MKLNSKALFYTRAQKAWLKAIRILRLVMGGGGTPLFVGGLFITLYYGYERFLAWIPAQFPIISLFALIFALFLTSSRIRTWVHPSDPVFLIPAESELGSYFRASLSYSILVHLTHLTLIVGFVSPLLLTKGQPSAPLWLAFLLLGATLTLNVLMEWQEMRLSVERSPSLIKWRGWVRFLLNLVIAYMALKGNWGGLLISLLVIVFIWLRQQVSISPSPYPWNLLIAQEGRIIAQYQVLAGWFVDMPRIKLPVKRRTWLVFLADLLPGGKKALNYLYWRHFLRKSELFSIYLHQIGWATVLIALFPNPWVITFVDLASVWMLALQLPSMASSERFPVLFHLYPLSEEEYHQSLAQLGYVLLGFQTFWLGGLCFTFGWLSPDGTLLFLAGGSLLAGLISRWYLPTVTDETHEKMKK